MPASSIACFSLSLGRGIHSFHPVNCEKPHPGPCRKLDHRKVPLLHVSDRVLHVVNPTGRHLCHELLSDWKSAQGAFWWRLVLHFNDRTWFKVNCTQFKLFWSGVLAASSLEAMS
jgi:hypothetical protein